MSAFFSKTKKHSVVLYILSILGLVLLIFGAFMGPQIIFEVGDFYQWQGVELGQRDKMDFVALSTSYETSLEIRMKNFAEGIQNGEQYYVASQEFTDFDKALFLFEDPGGFYRDIFYILHELDLFPPLFREGYTVISGRQYVIYSGDYTKGVNFIIWSIRLESLDGQILDLLLDAEDGTVYAMKFYGAEYANGYNRFFPKYQYLALDAPEYVELNYVVGNIIAYSCGAEALSVDEMAEKGIESVEYSMENNVYRLKIPYEEYSLNYEIRPTGEAAQYHETGIISNNSLDLNRELDIIEVTYLPVYPSFVAGVRELYELIPGFSEDS